MMKASLQSGLAFALLALAFCCSAPAAFAEEKPYEYNPDLSLNGSGLNGSNEPICGTNSVDPIPDPGCPGGAHPPKSFQFPDSIAIDAYGNEYVSVYSSDGTQGRIDIFNPEGFFIGEFQDPHGPQSIGVDKKGNLYVYEGTSVTQAEVVRYTPTVYEPEAGKIEYNAASRFAFQVGGWGMAGLTVDMVTGHVFAIGSSIEEYGSAEEGNELLHSIADPKIQSPALLAVDGVRRRLYTSSCKESGVFHCEVLVFELPAVGAEPKAPFSYPFLKEIDGSTTPGGEFLSQNAQLSTAVDEDTGHFFIDDVQKTRRIVEFGASYEYLSTIERPFLQDSFISQMAVGNAEAAPNHHYLYIPIATISGIHEAFAFTPSNIGPPLLESVKATSISEREAALQATIAPRGADTQYIFELEEEGSGVAIAVGEGTISKEALKSSVTAPLTGLSPGTVYRFTLIATNEKGTEEAEGHFVTYADASSAGPCPNQSLRGGTSSSLPDCRAYELVTPPDTNGRPVRGGGYPGYYSSYAFNASPLGSSVTFMTEGGSLPGMEGTGSFEGDRYRSTRDPVSGWSTASAGPSGAESEGPMFGATSPDQGYNFWAAEGEGSANIGGFPNQTFYVEYPDGQSELVGIGTEGFDQNAEGLFLTENATHIIFRTRNTPVGDKAQQLEPNAPPEGTGAIYDRSPGGKTFVVSLLPGSIPPQEGEDASYLGASADGAGIAFAIENTLYLRVDHEATYKIGENVTFAGIAEGGRRIFYVQGGNLLAFDTEAKETIKFTETGNATVVNVAPDGSRAYFVSTTKIAGSGIGPNGATPKSGQENLYLSEEGRIRFIAIVTKTDVDGEELEGIGPAYGLGLWTTAAKSGREPTLDSSRLNPSGAVLLFQSRASLDGSETGGSPQVYRYDSVGNRLHCVSCIPTRAPEGGGASLQTFGPISTSIPPSGAMIFVQNLSPDGKRAVFESKEALVSTDKDGVQDVYEWEEDGVGTCTRPGGCIYLLSSGHSAEDNYLYAMSQSGDDVFFDTADILVPGDNDTKSIYDARVNGGFVPQIEDNCSGEGCRPGLGSAPDLTAPGSAPTGAHDNVKPRKCPKGKRKVKRNGKVRCVKKHRKHHHHSKIAAKKRRAA